MVSKNLSENLVWWILYSETFKFIVNTKLYLKFKISGLENRT